MSYLTAFAAPDEPEDFDGLDAFDKIEPAQGHEPLPPGIYNVRVLKGSYDKTRSGKDSYKMTFEVIEGPFASRRLYRNWTFTAKALPYAKRDLAEFGLSSQSALLKPFPAAGEEVLLSVVVAIQQSDGYAPRNDIKAFKNIVRKPVEPLPMENEKSPFGGFSLDKPQSEGGN